MKKTILCYGDSNTYGYIPTGGRYDAQTRWPRRMAALLGDACDVVEEGFNGRTCVMDDPTEGGFKSGLAHLPPILMSHTPLDVVLLMLGTNDTKRRFGLSAMTIGQGMTQLVRTARQYAFAEDGRPSRIVIVSPPLIGENLMQTRFAEGFGEQAIEVSRGLAREYRRVSKLMRCDYFDAAPFAEVSPLDAVHMTARGHLQLAEALAEKLRAVLELA